ncbi:MAG: glycosyltransferase family 4 protein [Thermodesulfobacteriota bacterium]|nr:glycosyltransferase family 4 protein [Thermodesulfobacteriota bacterium]
MKSLLINTSDITGGAAIAAYRIHKGLQGIGIDSKMLVQTKSSDDKTVIDPGNKLKRGLALLRPTFDSAFKKLFADGSKTIFSPAGLPFSGILSQINSISPDIVHLHWICDGMLRIEELKRIDKPIIWTLHDMWSFTGGCHYNDGCERFQQACGNCPQLNRSGKNDLSRSVLRRKKKAWSKLNITIVTPSTWLAECAKESSLFSGRRMEVIHNGLNLNLFKPINKTTAREIWNLPINKKLILFGAMSATGDHRKGFDLLYEGLRQLSVKWTDKADLVVFGSSEPENSPDFGLPVHYLGYLYDDVSLALLYAAVDVIVTPSRQDNLPNTVVESLACGTPAVAFDIGGMPDMIEHKINGYLAKPFDTSDLAAGIDWVLSDDKRHKDLCIKAREKAMACFDIEKIAKQYAELYESII